MKEKVVNTECNENFSFLLIYRHLIHVYTLTHLKRYVPLISELYFASHIILKKSPNIVNE